MKSFYITGFIIIFSVLGIFSARLLTYKAEPKVAHFNVSLEFEKKGDYQKAISELQSAYEENKGSYLYNLRLGWLYYSVKDYKNSRKYYSTAISINKTSLEALYGSTYPMAAQGEWGEIQKTYIEILKLSPNEYLANLRLGQIYLNSSDFLNAKKHLEKAWNAYPGYYEPNLSLGYTYYYLGNGKKAQELLTNALMVSANDSTALAGLKLIK
ncbi:MAG: tetratricopeptide repeat protein [Ignavibacteria bacterium]|nr:tetratricopeptide repeat protein [Ignavibacteria bacterium]